MPPSPLLHEKIVELCLKVFLIIVDNFQWYHRVLRTRFSRQRLSASYLISKNVGIFAIHKPTFIINLQSAPKKSKPAIFTILKLLFFMDKPTTWNTVVSFKKRTNDQHFFRCDHHRYFWLHYFVPLIILL